MTRKEIAYYQYIQNLKAYKEEVKRYIANPVNKKEHEEILRDAIIRMEHARVVFQGV